MKRVVATSAELNAESLGHDVLDLRGHRIGRLVALYRDVDSHVVCFGIVATVHRVRRRQMYVPMIDATVGPESIIVRCGAELARRSPSTQVGRALTPDLEADLYRHYELPYATPGESGARLERCN